MCLPEVFDALLCPAAGIAEGVADLDSDHRQQHREDQVDRESGQVCDSDELVGSEGNRSESDTVENQAEYDPCGCRDQGDAVDHPEITGHEIADEACERLWAGAACQQQKNSETDAGQSGNSELHTQHREVMQAGAPWRRAACGLLAHCLLLV